MDRILLRDMLLRQIYFGFRIHTVALSCTHTHAKKACNHTQGDACAPLQLVTLCFYTVAHTCTLTRTLLGGGGVHVCALKRRENSTARIW